MGKTARIALAALTAWPLAYMAIFMGTVLRFALGAMAQAPGSAPPQGPPTWFGLLFVAHLGTMLVALGLTIFYVVHAYRSPRVPETRRVLWVVLNILGGFVGQLAYWYLFIWREPEVLDTTLAQGAARR